MPRPLLSEEEIVQALIASKWTRDGGEITRQVKRADFKEAMAFVNQVADLAESFQHHPDIAISWNRVDLRVSTHDSGGLTALDFELAKGVDALDGSG